MELRPRILCPWCWRQANSGWAHICHRCILLTAEGYRRRGTIRLAATHINRRHILTSGYRNFCDDHSCTFFGRLPGLHPGNRPFYSVQKMPVNQRGKIWPLIAIGLAAFLVFANSLGNGLVYDDHFLIERNRLLREADVWGILTTHYWAGYEGEANINGQYRPLTVLSFMLDGLGGIWPFRFHLTNTILHVVNSLLAYLLYLNLGLKPGRDPGRTAICRTSHPCRSRRRHNIWACRSIDWPVFSISPAPVHPVAQPERRKVLRIGPRGILSRLALQRKRDNRPWD